MSSIIKFTGYAAAVLASLAVALAVLVAAPAEEAAAGPVAVTTSSEEISAAGSVDITVTDSDLNPSDRATGFAIFTINPLSIGTAKFKSGGGQSLICVNGSSSCDTEDDTNTIVVRVEAQGGIGVVIVDVQLIDGVDSDTPSQNAGQVAWTQTAPATTLKASPTSLTAAADGDTAATLLIEVLNAKGNRVSDVEVTVVTTVGSINSVNNSCTLDDPDGTVTPLDVSSDATCSFMSLGETTTGDATTLSLYGTGAETVGQVIINAGNLETVTIPFVLTGPAASVTASADRSIIGGYSDSVTKTSTITVKVLDANGNVVAGTVSATVKSPATKQVKRVIDGDKIIFEADAKTALGDHVIELEADGKKTTVTITVAGKPASVSIAAPESIEPLAAGIVLVSVRDADDNPVPAGTDVNIAATGDGAIIRSEHKTVGDSGDVSVTVIAADKDTGGLIAIFALVGDDLSAHAVVLVGSVVEPDPVPVAAFVPTIAAAGQTFTSYSGGTVADLMAALAAAGATSASATTADGSTVTVIVTTLGFVNADFNAAFSSGVPAGTILAVRSLN